MPTPKAWKNGEAGGTPISAAALIDMEERLQRGISVKDYGAKGDGETDDSTAILEAMEAANAAGGTGTDEAGAGVVYLPPGDWKVSSNLLAALLEADGHINKIRIVGAGMQVTHLVMTDETKDLFGATATSESPDGYISIENLTLRGPNAGTGNGVNLVYCNPLLRLTNVEAIRFGGDGVKLAQCFEGQITNYFGKFNGGWGLNLDYTNDSLMLNGVFVSNNTTGGLRIADGWQGPGKGVWAYGNPTNLLLENSATAGKETHSTLQGAELTGVVVEGDESQQYGIRVRSLVETDIYGVILVAKAFSGAGKLVSVDNCVGGHIVLRTKPSGAPDPVAETALEVLEGCSDIVVFHSHKDDSGGETTEFSDAGTRTRRLSAGRWNEVLADALKVEGGAASLVADANEALDQLLISNSNAGASVRVRAKWRRAGADKFLMSLDNSDNMLLQNLVGGYIGLYSGSMQLQAEEGKLLAPNLPTEDPKVAGQLWNEGGTLKVSAG